MKVARAPTYPIRHYTECKIRPIASEQRYELNDTATTTYRPSPYLSSLLWSMYLATYY
jgi:hypothetical protein